MKIRYYSGVSTPCPRLTIVQHYEYKFISKLIKDDKHRAFKFRHCTRFIDDECNINDSNEFSNSFNQIYPQELTLKCEHHGTHASFLDLDISIVDGIFEYKLYDKRDDYPFYIVRMPDFTANIPSYALKNAQTRCTRK